jgi:DNA-binding NarL/FixJ family response regulator
MKLYIVEDDEDMRFLLKRILKKNFPSITEFKESVTAEQAINEIPEMNPDLVLVDISLPGMNGIELISKLKPTCNYICILVVTGHEVEIYKHAALEAGAHGIVSKSDTDRFLDYVKKLIEKRKER